jgi:hypothetical protein
LWKGPLVSSRLLVYELWNRIHGRGLTRSHADAARELIARLGFVELVEPVLARALEPFPLPVRTLDALHMASLDFLRSRGQDIELASYDERQLEVARRLRVPIVDLDDSD